MATVSPPTFPPPSSSTRPDPIPHKFPFHTTRIPSKSKRSSYSISSTSHHSLFRAPDSTICRCHNNNSENSADSFRWDAAVQEVVRSAVKWFDDNVGSSLRGGGESKGVAGSVVGVLEREIRSEDVEEGSDGEEDWDWEQWRKHFDEVDEQARVVSLLKSQLANAVDLEDFEVASSLKVAIAATATNDTVGRVMSHLNRAIKEERYRDAAIVRDCAGAGLVGWWAGIAEDSNDPYGRIIRISAEHGRYVARSYSSQQLATATAGIPLFEIFLKVNKKGEYKEQAVYLGRMGAPRDFSVVSSRPLDPTGSLNTLDSTAKKPDLFAGPEDSEDRDDDSNIAEGLPGFDNVLRDMIPGVKFKVLNVTASENVDRDLISKVIEQLIDEEDEEKDAELESVDAKGDKDESDQEHKGTEINASDGILDGEQQSEIGVMCKSDGFVQKVSSSAPNKNLIRLPARLEKKGHLSFSFSVEKDESQQVPRFKGKRLLRKRKAKHGVGLLNITFDMAKSKAGRGKMLEEISELLTFTLSGAQNRQLLSGSTTFNRIEIPQSPDPLNGLYISADGPFSSDVIHLRHKVGQWQEDGGSKEPLNPEFYEYVEAVKLTGDPYVPAGQVAFRAKVGKRYQLPHKGIIPEDIGVIARYKGQGRIAEPGFLNPRWVDGELVVLDGKFTKGELVGFLYWSPEYCSSAFFNRLRLQE